MRALLNAMKMHAQQQVSQLATVRVGQVTSYDPGSYSAKVQLLPEGAETGWLPVLSQWTGNGWGLFTPPTPGDFVEVHFIDGDFTQGVVCLRFFNDIARPLNVPSGELWAVHKSGAFFKLTNDGKALINGQLEIDATAPTINVTATGNVNVQAGGTATIQAPSIILKNAGSALKKLCNDVLISLFNNHTHTTATSGNPTSTPNQTATVGTHTTNIVQAE